MNELSTATKPDAIATTESFTYDINKVEEFNAVLARNPNPLFVKKTPDGQADTIVISHIETMLDAIFLMQWGVEDERTVVIANELVMRLQLWVVHPISKMLIQRTGVAAIAIMVDSVPKDKSGKPTLFGKEKNQWHLDLNNKKPNALKINYPALKAVALKNAAKSLGNIFGRNLNRDFEDTPDMFWTKEIEAKAETERIDAIGELECSKCTTKEELIAVHAKYPADHNNEYFKSMFNYWRQQIKFKTPKPDPTTPKPE